MTNPTVIKMVSKKEGSHVKMTIFMGPEGHTLVNVGTLTQTMGEWQLFGAMVLIAADVVNKNHLRVCVISEGDDEVVEEGEEHEVKLVSRIAAL